MANLTCTVDFYRGRDGDRLFTAAEGDVVEVSDGKAEQLLRDFPAWFTLGEPAEAEPETEAPEVEEPEVEEPEDGEPAEAEPEKPAGRGRRNKET